MAQKDSPTDRAVTTPHAPAAGSGPIRERDPNRDKAIDHLRLLITDRDREIDELQHRLLQAEEARIADASAILESLDKYRI